MITEKLEQPKIVQPPPYFWTHELTHNYGGNGLYYLCDFDGRHCRVCDQKINQVWVADASLLRKFEVKLPTDPPTMKEFPIKPEMIEALKEARAKLETGQAKIINGYVR